MWGFFGWLGFIVGLEIWFVEVLVWLLILMLNYGSNIVVVDEFTFYLVLLLAFPREKDFWKIHLVETVNYPEINQKIGFWWVFFPF